MDEPGLTCCKYLHLRLTHKHLPKPPTSSSLPSGVMQALQGCGRPRLPYFSSPLQVLIIKGGSSYDLQGGAASAGLLGLLLVYLRNAGASESSISSQGAHGASGAKAGCRATEDAAVSSRPQIPRLGRGLFFFRLSGKRSTFQLPAGKVGVWAL